MDRQNHIGVDGVVKCVPSVQHRGRSSTRLFDSIDKLLDSALACYTVSMLEMGGRSVLDARKNTTRPASSTTTFLGYLFGFS